MQRPNMAQTVERRAYTRTTRTSEGASEIRQNLSQVAEEIARVRDRAREEVKSLEKIRGMLDVDYLNKLIETIDELEVRMQTLEEAALGSAGEADRAQAELRKEQERLAKLWDAYKAQEDELAALKRDAPALQERLADRELTLESLRREVARLEPLGRYKSDYDEAARENQALRVEAESLNREVRRMADELRRRDEEMAVLREDAGSKARVREMEAALEEERERLAKLYKVYEEQEAKLRESSERLERWEAWFSRMEPAMTSFCRGVSDAPRV